MIEIEDAFKEVCNADSESGKQMGKVNFYKKVIELRMKVRKEGVNHND